jgi:hypothetical protein
LESFDWWQASQGNALNSFILPISYHIIVSRKIIHNDGVDDGIANFIHVSST